MSVHVSKRWSVNVLSSENEALAIFCDGRPLTQSAPATIDQVSPVEYLLIAAGSCFALSCRAALAARKLPRVVFEVVTTGEKAADAPSRLKSIAMVVIFRGGLDEAQAAAIAVDAKRLCTVTSTILGSPAVTVGARSMGS